MDDLMLLFPSEDYLDEIRNYRQEMLENNSSMDGCGILRQTEDPVEWIEYSKNCLALESLKPGLVLATQFICIRKSDQKLVGMIQVRHYFNDYLAEYGGHIGYSVRPSERRKGYAKWMLKTVLPYCKQLGINRVLITCLESNEASRKTILSQNGIFERTTYLKEEDETLERYWIDLGD